MCKYLIIEKDTTKPGRHFLLLCKGQTRKGEKLLCFLFVVVKEKINEDSETIACENVYLTL